MKKTKNPISNYEISIIKKLYKNKNTYQDILFKINLYRYLKEQNTLNQARIPEITNTSKLKDIKLAEYYNKIPPAEDNDLEKFNQIITCSNLETKLSSFINDHKLIIKAREAMISAITVFNSPKFNFAVENFLTLSCIGWTALLQSIAKLKNINIINDKDKKYSSLSFLLKKMNEEKILNNNIKANLEAIIDLRDSITHSPDTNISKDITSLLQANCFNFNKIIMENYGKHRGLDNIFSIALQMASFNPNNFLSKVSDNKFEYINPIKNFEDNLDKEILKNPEYRCNIAIIPTSVNRESNADFVYIVNPHSEEAKNIQNIIFKSKLIDKAENYPNNFKEIIVILKNKNYKINSHILNKIIKENQIKNQDKYSYKSKIGKTTYYKYSIEFINFLETLLEKNK